VRKYLTKRLPGRPCGDLRWSTFLRNQATAILACDFFVAVTATFRMLSVFVVIEHGTRRLVHVNVTTHPSAAWTMQQLREVIADTDDHKYLIHDRDSIFARHVDDSIRAMGLAVLRSPFSSPKANAICQRVIGAIRRECLDWMIPVSEGHLRSILREWVAHYNSERPHSALGPGVPGPPAGSAPAANANADVYGRRVRSCSRNRCWARCITSTHSRRYERPLSRCQRRQQIADNGESGGVRVVIGFWTLPHGIFCGAQRCCTSIVKSPRA
jgi:putative transposase